MALPVFISWSGEKSREAAAILKEWIPDVIQNVTPFVSEDINAGSRWSHDIARELEGSAFGILCLTPENLSAPWVLFEAGALSKSISSSHVVPLLIGVDRAKIELPISQFQSILIDEKEFLSLFKSINACCVTQLDDARLIKAFTRTKEEYLTRLKSVAENFNHGQPDIKQAPNSAEALDNILKTMQSIQVFLSSSEILSSNRQFTQIIEEIRKADREPRTLIPGDHPAWYELERSLVNLKILFDNEKMKAGRDLIGGEAIYIPFDSNTADEIVETLGRSIGYIMDRCRIVEPAASRNQRRQFRSGA